jgi:PAS domain S-box-containing protein
MQRTKLADDFLIALAAVGVASLVRWGMAPNVGEEFPLITYFLAVAAVAWLAAPRPALIALLMGAVAGEALFRPPAGLGTEALVLLRYFIIGGATIVGFTTLNAVHRRADRHQALLADTVRAALDGIIMADHEGRIIEFNEAAEGIFGYRRADALGRNLSDLIGEMPELGRRVEITARRADGGEFPLEISVTRVADSDTPVFTAFTRDITQRHRTERELHETARRLTHANELQSHFLAMLSHELRNPLAPIRNGVSILQMTRGPGDKGAPTLDMISRHVSRLVRLIDDLLDVNRITTGRIRIRKERVDLSRALTDTIEIAQAQSVDGGHRFQACLPHAPLWIDGDPTRIGQVVTSLIHNAFKFTPRGGDVTLAVAREGEEAVIRVRDTGMGIPERKLQDIFGMFEQLAPGPELAPGGLGIGLSLSKGLVQMHGGRIEARSDGPGKGTELIVRLPLADAAANDSRAA